jgi:hypothetical protein
VRGWRRSKRAAKAAASDADDDLAA